MARRSAAPFFNLVLSIGSADSLWASFLHHTAHASSISQDGHAHSYALAQPLCHLLTGTNAMSFNVAPPLASCCLKIMKSQIAFNSSDPTVLIVGNLLVAYFIMEDHIISNSASVSLNSL